SPLLQISVPCHIRINSLRFCCEGVPDLTPCSEPFAADIDAVLNRAPSVAPRKPGRLNEKQARTPMKKNKPNDPAGGASASDEIDATIRELGDWRGKTLARVRGI